MGTFRALRPGIGSADLVAAAQLVPSGVVDIRSPWAPTPSHLASVVWSDIFGADVPTPLSRAEAMRVPAVARARHIICGTVARIDLRGYRGEAELPPADQPAWIAQTGTPVSPFHRMLWTVDDQLFYGWSLWRRENSAADGFPLRMNRVPIESWRLTSAGVVELNYGDPVGWQPARASEVVLLPGPHEGLLTFGVDAIRHAADLQAAAGRAAHNPAAYLALKQTGGTPLQDDDIDALISRWAAARRGENGGVAFLNESIDAQEMGTFDRHLVVDGRNAAAVDVARVASIPADLLDAAGEASLTYQNSRDNDRRAVDYGIGLYMSANSSALSQDAVTPRGQRVAFDLEQWLAGTVPGQPAAPPSQTPPPAPAAPLATPAPAGASTGEPPQ